MNITNSYRRYAMTLKEINDYALHDPKGFVEMSEYAYRSDIKEIARRIKDDKEKCRVILLAGPSASGKTTTAKMLNEEFENIGCGSEIRPLLAAEVLERFFAYSDRLPDRSYMEEYRRRSILTGKAIEYEAGGASHTAEVIGIDDAGF